MVVAKVELYGREKLLAELSALPPVYTQIYKIYVKLGLESNFSLYNEKTKKLKSIKKLKTEIVWDFLDFNGTKDFNRNNPFELKGSKEFLKRRTLRQIGRLIRKRIFKENKILHLRFVIDGQGSDNPVSYLLSKKDVLDRCVFSKDGMLIKIKLLNGEWLNLLNFKKDIHIDIWHQDSAVKEKMKGFTNPEYERKEVEIGLGGGFRMQLDRMSRGIVHRNIEFINTEGELEVKKEKLDAIILDVTNIFVFNNVGPRCTALANEYDTSIPRYETKYRLAIVGDALRLIDENNNVIDLDQSHIYQNIEDAIENKKINDYSLALMQYYLKADGKALASLFAALMRVDLANERHSVEAVISLIQDKKTDKRMIQHKTTSFDGFDSAYSAYVKLLRRLKKEAEKPGANIEELNKRIDIVKRAIYGEVFLEKEEKELLRIINLLHEAQFKLIAIDLFLDFLLLNTTIIGISNCIHEILSYPGTDEIAKRIESLVKESIGDKNIILQEDNKMLSKLFTPERTGPRLLAMALAPNRNIEWVEASHSDGVAVSSLKHESEDGTQTLIKVDVEGFEMVFWINEKGELVEIKSSHDVIKKYSSKLNKFSGVNIVGANRYLMREGD